MYNYASATLAVVTFIIFLIIVLYFVIRKRLYLKSIVRKIKKIEKDVSNEKEFTDSYCIYCLEPFKTSDELQKVEFIESKNHRHQCGHKVHKLCLNDNAGDANICLYCSLFNIVDSGTVMKKIEDRNDMCVRICCIQNVILRKKSISDNFSGIIYTDHDYKIKSFPLLDDENVKCRTYVQSK